MIHVLYDAIIQNVYSMMFLKFKYNIDIKICNQLTHTHAIYIA